MSATGQIGRTPQVGEKAPDITPFARYGSEAEESERVSGEKGGFSFFCKAISQHVHQGNVCL